MKWITLRKSETAPRRRGPETAGSSGDHTFHSTSSRALIEGLRLNPGVRHQAHAGSEFRLRPATALPERYAIAMFGRQRSTLDVLRYLERRGGKESRQRALRRLHIKDGALGDSMAPVSIRLISDLCESLARFEGFSRNDVFNIGVSSARNNARSVLSVAFASTTSPSQIYERMFGDLQKFYEQNCNYQISQLSESHCQVQVRSNPQIADLLRVRKLGNEHICALKAGIFASAPHYLGLPFARVEETHCEHRGEEFCRFHIDFSEAQRLVAQRARELTPPAAKSDRPYRH